MAQVVGNTIYMPRGDTGYFTVKLLNLNIDDSGNKTYTPYTIKSTDKLKIAVAPLNAKDDSETLVRKEVTGTSNWGFVPADTENLAPGTYMYNIKLHTAAGEKITVVKSSHLVLEREVD